MSIRYCDTKASGDSSGGAARATGGGGLGRHSAAAVLAASMLAGTAMASPIALVNGDFETGDLAGWTLWGVGQTELESEVTSWGEYRREVGPEFAHDGIHGLRLRCAETGRFDETWWCDPGVAQQPQSRAPLHFWFRLVQDGGYWAKPLFVTIYDPQGRGVRFSFDTGPSDASCINDFDVCETMLPEGVWLFRSLNLAGAYGRIYGRPLPMNYVLLFSTYADDGASEAWVDSIGFGGVAGPLTPIPGPPHIR